MHDKKEAFDAAAVVWRKGGVVVVICTLSSGSFFKIGSFARITLAEFEDHSFICKGLAFYL